LIVMRMREDDTAQKRWRDARPRRDHVDEGVITSHLVASRSHRSDRANTRSARCIDVVVVCRVAPRGGRIAKETKFRQRGSAPRAVILTDEIRRAAVTARAHHTMRD